MGAAAAGAGIQAASEAAKTIWETRARRELAEKLSKVPAYLPPGAPEKRFRHGLRDIFGAAAGVTGAGVGQLAMIMPEIYRQLGYEPTIIDRTADAAAAQEEVNTINERIADLQAKKAKAPRGSDKIAKLQKQLKKTKKELADKQRTLTDLQAQPIQITGLTPISAEDTTPTGTRQIVDLTTQQAIEALQGKVETDPTLLREFDEEEATIRETLRRQLGPGYETSTAGIQALNDFQRKKKESIAGYTRDLAASMSERALGGESVLSDLLSARLNQLTYPSGQTQAAGGSLASLINPGLGIQALMLEERRKMETGGGIAAAGLGAITSAAGGMSRGGAAANQLVQGVADWWGRRSAGDQAILSSRSVKDAPMGTYVT